MNSYGLWIATEINEHYDCDNSKESFIKVAMARQIASKEPKILWDLNPCSPNHRIYKDYIDRYQKQEFLGGYNYGHFTIEDNLSISEERKQEIISQYGVGTVWFKRDILGMRCVAEGNIYEDFANNTQNYLIDEKELQRKTITHINIGVDFGGNKSANTFVAVGFTPMLREVIVLESKRIEGKTTPTALENEFVEFAEMVQEKYKGGNVYCDSAEQTLIGGFRKAIATHGLRFNVNDATKNPINDRIRMVLKLMSSGRFKVCQWCGSVIKALSEAVYSNKEGHEDERLDNFTFDVDSIDALEYAVEPHLKELRYG